MPVILIGSVVLDLAGLWLGIVLFTDNDVNLVVLRTLSILIFFTIPTILYQFGYPYFQYQPE